MGIPASIAIDAIGFPPLFRVLWRHAQNGEVRAGIVIELMKAGVSQVEIAEDLDLSPSMIGKYAKRGYQALSSIEQSKLVYAFRDHRRPRIERFWDFVIPEPNTGCWIYVGDDNGHGYGLFDLGGDQGKQYAHRISHEVLVGPIPLGHHVDHLCFVRCCVNPDHLEAVTPKVNQERMAARQRRLKAGGLW